MGACQSHRRHKFSANTQKLPVSTPRRRDYDYCTIFPLYMESLRKLAAYEVEICAFDHHGVFIADQAKNILQQELEQTEGFKNYVINQYRQIGDLDKIAQNLTAAASEKNKFDFLSLELETTVAKTVIRKILS